MLSSLLGLLVLFSIGSAMLLPNTTKYMPEEEGSTADPNTIHWSAPSKEPLPEGMPSWWSNTRSMSPVMPPPGQPWPPSDNMTQGPDMPRMLLPTGPQLPPLPNTAICDMLLNAPVPPPIDQIPFFCICSHCKGTVGPKGDHGDRGPPGQPGSPGRQGMTGFKGNRGFTGPQGIKGQKGDNGEKGDTGMVGLMGTKGERGFKGDKGDQGSMGPPGQQGPAGETGTCPASCESVPGAPGLQGSPGMVGARGLPGLQGSVGPKGLKGDKGELGKPGEPGVNGIKGDQGEQGICHCTDGANGVDGRPGEKGDKGEKGNFGLPGTQGPIGMKGDQGNMGFMGPPGPCTPAIQSAFSACLNESFPRQNWPIAFSHILSNQQGHFDPSMGIYTAPVNGTYVFSFHLATSQKPLKVGMFLNFYPVVRITEISSQGSTSQTIVLHLNMRDRVWLQVKDTATNGIFVDSESSSTFSGFLLHPDNCDIPLGRHHMFMETYPMDGFGWDGPLPSTPMP
ncbi:inner ear-specific collagen [Melanotaenia boesemani]|uniref:inner ear-specific collagen n=1 Tax=Melanotaenia boesemani TaxID=1250792 RepID=UPI001C048E69|nr:inner ear-specific collagen [Melanotaenia boesemani]